MNIKIPAPFFLAASNRSGSHLLTSLINSTKQMPPVANHLAGLMPASVDHCPKDEDIIFYFQQLYERLMADWTNLTEHWGIMLHMDGLVIARHWLELTDQPMRWIWLRRKNKARQAISDIKVGKTKIEHLDIADSPEKKELARAEIDIDIHDLYRIAICYFIEDTAWEGFFKQHSIVPHTIYYEDFIDESTWELTIKGIFDFLNVPYQLPLDVSTHRLKQAVGKTPESYKRLIKGLEEYGIPLEYTDLDME